MSNVLIDREKIDILANAISLKSGEPLTLTLDEMVSAVDGIPTGDDLPKAGTLSAYFYGNIEDPNLWSLNGRYVTFNVDETRQGSYVTAESSGWVNEGSVDDSEITLELRGEYQLPSASAVDEDYASEFYNDGNTRKWRTRYWIDYNNGGFIDGVHYGLYLARNAVPSNTSVTPTESSQTIGGNNYMMEGAITVNAIPSNYVGSGITQRSSSDLTASGATVTAPSGYYSAQASKTVTTMTLPTSAASSATSGYTSKATIGRSTAAQYINIPPGYNSTGAYYVIGAVANGSATAPASISGTAASVSTGTNTLTLTKTVSVTPTVSAGYVSAGTASNSSVSLTASVTTKAAATITPTTTNQTIAAGTYLTGIQTIAGDTDLVGSNILSTANIFGVQGTVVVQNYYTGSSAPSSSLGSNGDLYLQS